MSRDNNSSRGSNQGKGNQGNTSGYHNAQYDRNNVHGSGPAKRKPQSTKGGNNNGSSQENRYNMQYQNPQSNPRSNPNNRPPVNGNKKSKRLGGKALAIIQALLSLFVLGLVFIIDVLPLTYLLAAGVVLLLLFVFSYFSQYTRKTHVAGKVESVLISVLLIACSYYLLITQGFLSNIAPSGYRVDNIVVVVLNDDPAQSISDAADYRFGIQSTIDRDKVDQTIEKLNKQLGKEINIVTYDGYQAQIDAFYSGEVQALIYNQAYNGTFDELHEGFPDDIRILDNLEIKTQVETEKINAQVTKQTFSIYLSGIDIYGSISQSSRSDVNLIATVNPVTKQILLTTTPRDYFVTLPGVSNGDGDKLTHAGIYGTDCSIQTLEEIYDIDISYYARVNFTSLIKIVDLLGGVDVYSEYDFTAISGEHYSQGYNYVNGTEALAFARERYSFQEGDFQRGKNQQALLTALIKKCMSPSILASYADIMAELEDNFETSMPSGDITSLIKMQLADGGEWNIVSQNVTGSFSNEYCYSAPSQLLSVIIPDEESVAAAKAKIQQVYDGEILQADATQ